MYFRCPKWKHIEVCLAEMRAHWVFAKPRNGSVRSISPVMKTSKRQLLKNWVVDIIEESLWSHLNNVKQCVKKLLCGIIGVCMCLCAQEWVLLHQESFSRISATKLLEVVGFAPRFSQQLWCSAETYDSFGQTNQSPPQIQRVSDSTKIWQSEIWSYSSCYACASLRTTATVTHCNHTNLRQATLIKRHTLQNAARPISAAPTFSRFYCLRLSRAFEGTAARSRL